MKAPTLRVDLRVISVTDSDRDLGNVDALPRGPRKAVAMSADANISVVGNPVPVSDPFAIDQVDSEETGLGEAATWDNAVLGDSMAL